MPRDGNGNATLDPIYKATTGETIEAVQHNTPLADIESMLTGSVARNGAGGMLADLPMNSHKVTGLTAGVEITDAATIGQLQNATPIGSVIDFAGATAPAGWLLCQGQAVSRATYAALFALIGTTYGVGDGSTTFNLPDCQGRVRVGKDKDAGVLSTFIGAAAKTLAGVFGAASHVLTTGQMPSHTHGAGTLATASAGDHSHTVPNASSQSGSNGGAGSAPTGTISTSTAGAHTHTITGSTASSGSGEAHNNVQPTIVFNTIIKAFFA